MKIITLMRNVPTYLVEFNQHQYNAVELYFILKDIAAGGIVHLANTELEPCLLRSGVLVKTELGYEPGPEFDVFYSELTLALAEVGFKY